MTYEDTDSAISSLESEDGATPCASQESKMTDLFGQALAPVSRSAPQASSVAATMSATYGLRSSASSASVALQACLASRLPELLASRGSITFALTWKAQSTPQRRQLCRLVASARTTDESGCSGWPTPNAGPQNENDSTFQQRREALKLKHGNGNGFGLNLGQAATLAGWPTPMAGTPAQNGNNAAGNTDSSCKMPAHQDSEHSTANAKNRSDQMDKQIMLAHQVALALGPISNGSNAATEKRGQLNAAFSLWLMGLPVAEWLLAAPSEKPQPRSRKSKKRTSSAEPVCSEAPGTPSCPKSPPSS